MFDPDTLNAKERRLADRIARALGVSPSEAVRVALERTAQAVEEQSANAIRSTKTMLGGDHRIRNTRIPVWLLVTHKQWGQTDSEILAEYPFLNAADLSSAWDFYAANRPLVERERRRNES